MQIGDKVWIFDSNHRVYQDDKGNKTQSCWYRGHFVERYILGETKQSWIIGYKECDIDNRSNIKVNKKTLKYPGSFGMDGNLYTSEEEINQLCWIKDNKLKISEQVRSCNDYNILVQIKDILSR